MIIKITQSQKNFLINDILQNDEIAKYIDSNSFFINDAFKFEISDILLSDILNRCYGYLFKIGFDEHNDLSVQGELTQQLISINKQINDYYKIQLKNQILLIHECLEMLGNDVIIIKNHKEVDRLFNLLTSTMPFGSWGRVDWDNIEKKIQFDDPEYIINAIHQLIKTPNLDIYIYWDNADVPVIATKLYQALRIIDDVTKIGFYTWLFCPKSKYVIEFTDAIRVGVITEI